MLAQLMAQIVCAPAYAVQVYQMPSIALKTNALPLFVATSISEQTTMQQSSQSVVHGWADGCVLLSARCSYSYL